ncbi:nucleolar protein 11 L homeolog isoform X1 [Xenopus laevis]|uniref:Nucleolar protein 11 L homeolog isoform X1 n=1 Tax=Xenopus laevis TaxID=8355 RepID=A0A8J0TS86_XENLA|nr:nucleolar protein 11 L homeolog isoform X1 [Xenopus laevis]
MAALSEHFTLCGLLTEADDGRTEILGVEPAGEPDRVLVTDSVQAVTLYKVSDQKPLGAWAVKQGQSITCPAVLNHESGEFVVVHDGKVLRIWKEDNVNLDTAFKATLSADVCRIHTLPNADPLVLFKGGAVLFLDSLLADPQQEIGNILSDGERIVWSEIFADEGQPLIVYVTQQLSSYFVYIHNFSPVCVCKYHLKPNTEGSTILDCSGSVKSKIFTLLTLYSSGQVCQTPFPVSPIDQETERVVTALPLLQLSGPIEVGALKFLDESHVAVLMQSPSTQKDCLSIWNTTFQTLQTACNFPQKTSAQLWCSDNKLYVPHGKALVVVPYICEVSCLASVLGKSRNIETSENVPFVNWGKLVGKNLEVKQSNSGARKKTRDIKTNGNPGNGTECTLYPLDVQNMSQAQTEVLVQQLLLGKEDTDFQVTVGKITQSLVKHCMADPKYYPQSSLVQLVQTKTLSYSLCPELLSLCLEKRDVHLLQLCLHSFPDVPEAVLCSCLKAFLSISEKWLNAAQIDTESVTLYIDVRDKAKGHKYMEHQEEPTVVQNGFSPTALDEDSCGELIAESLPQTVQMATCPMSNKRAVLVNSVLMSPYSESFLLPHLKDMSGDQVMFFLRYLQYLYQICNENITVSLPGKQVPTVSQIMDWMNLLLDAHFATVVMLSEAKSLLNKIQKTVKSQLKFYSELNKIEGCLAELKELKCPASVSARYSIEVLKLY